MSNIYEKVIELFKTRDTEAAQKLIEENFGEDADLNIVKCEACSQIIALSVNILAKALTGGDTKVTLEVYKHILAHPDHAEQIYGYSHGVKLPIGFTLYSAIDTARKRYNYTLERALTERIKYLEAKLSSGSL